MKNVLVTGGAGLIGVPLARQLLRSKCTVIALDNFITSSRENIHDLLPHTNYTFIKHDVTKTFPNSLTRRPIDTIFHLACPTGVPNLSLLAEEMLLTSSIGTLNILQFAKKCKATVVFTSSSEVYGDPTVFPQTEEYNGNVDPIGPRSAYEEGKRFAESLIMTYVKKYGVDAKIVRIFNTYGPKKSDEEKRVMTIFINSAQKNKPLPIHGDGSQTRTFCYVDDLIDGLIRIAIKGKKGDVYNLGSDNEISIENLAKAIIRVTHSSSPIEHIARPRHDHKRRLPSLKKIKHLGWSPHISIEEGIRRSL